MCLYILLLISSHRCGKNFISLRFSRHKKKKIKQKMSKPYIQFKPSKRDSGEKLMKIANTRFDRVDSEILRLVIFIKLPTFNSNPILVKNNLRENTVVHASSRPRKSDRLTSVTSS